MALPTESVGKFNLRTICNELGEAQYKWFKIGVQLGIPRHKLMEFKKEDDPLAAAIDYWLNGNVEGVPLIWKSIVAALKSSHVDESGLAKRIKRKYYCQEEFNDDSSSLCQESVATFPATSTTSSGSSSFKLPPTSMKAFFPYLHDKKISDEELSSLQFELDEQTTKIKRTFAGLVFKLRKYIEDNSKVDEVITILKLLDDEKLKDLLTNCSSVDQIFDHLDPYFSFFDFGIIKLLTSHLGSGSNKQRLKKYKKMFKEFSEHRVCECPSDAFGDFKKSEKHFFVKMDKHIRHLKVNELTKLKYEICQVLKLQLRLLHTEDGCVKLTFRVLANPMSITEEQQLALKHLCVLKIQYGDQVVDILSSSFEEKALGGESRSDSGFHTAETDTSSKMTHHRKEEDLNDPRLDMLDSVDRERLKMPSFSPLHEATLKGDLEEVKRLIKEEENPLNPDLYDDTLLHHAATLGELEILKYLIEDRQCIPAVQGWHGTTPLHSAAQAKQFAIVRYLIEEQKLDPTAVDDHGQFPLHYAYRFGNEEFVQYLMVSTREYLNSDDMESVLRFENICCDIERTFPVENPCPTESEMNSMYLEAIRNITPLQCASHAGDLRKVRSLVSKLTRTELNVHKHEDRLNCLTLAVFSGHIPLVKYFVKKLKWDPTHCEVDRNNAIYHAIHVGKLKMVKLFIDKLGYDPSRKDDNNYTPLHVASVAGHLPIVKYLIEEKHCDPNLTDSNRVNALHNAAHFGHYKLFRYLLEEIKMDQNEPNNDGLTPLSIAAIEGHLDIVAYLLKFDNTVQYDRRSRTPLFYAAVEGHFDVVKHLMTVNTAQCTLVSKLPKIFCSPLPCATANGYYDIVKYLIEESKCDPFMVYQFIVILDDSLFDGESTLLGLALYYQHYSLVHYFLQKLKDHSSDFIINFLHTVAQLGDWKVVGLLIDVFEFGRIPPDGEGRTLLYHAANHGHLGLMMYLVEHLEFNANYFDCFLTCSTPLHTSASKGHLHIVKYLTSKAKVCPFVYDKEGNTPLHYAAKSNQMEVVKFLTGMYEKYPFITNFRNQTPLSQAITARNSNSALLLIVVMFNLF